MKNNPNDYCHDMNLSFIDLYKGNWSSKLGSISLIGIVGIVFIYSSHGSITSSHVWLDLHFVSSSLHLHWLEICFANVFSSIIHVIMLKRLRFKYSVFFGTQALLDKSLITVQLRTHLSYLTANE